MADQLCVDINSEKDLNQIWSTVVRFSAYFNMELIKALMLHDSKREVEMFIDIEGKLVNKSYKNKAEMHADIGTFSAIYDIKKGG